MVGRLIANLPEQVDTVHLAVSFKAQKVQQWVETSGDPALVGRRVHVVKEDPPLGTGGALANLADTAGLADDGGPVLVLNGDLVADMDLTGLVAVHEEHAPLATLALVAVQDPSRYGIMEFGGSWRIRRFIEKPSREEAPSEWANAGAYVLEPEVIERIPRGRVVSLEREVFPATASAPAGMRGHPHRGLWIDCGTRESYLQAHRALLEQTGPSPAAGHDGVPETADRGGCFFAKGARVAPDAHVEGCVLQEDVVVGRGARVVDSILGAGCVVPDGAVVEQCVIAAGVVLHEGARVVGARVVHEATGRA